MSVFVDSSGLYALIDAGTAEHDAAAAEWARLRDEATPLRTHAYVIVETAVLVQRRLGTTAAADLHRNVVPVLSVRFVDRDLHRTATTALLAAQRRKVSLVDWTSFELMRAENLTEAFAFDNHFAEQGFTLRPAS